MPPEVAVAAHFPEASPSPMNTARTLSRGEAVIGARSLNPLVRGCVETWEQCRTLLLALDDEAYRRAACSTSSVGAHTRHCIDHYTSLLEGLDRGVVDYDRRERSPLLESDREAALEAIGDIMERLAAMDFSQLSTPLAVVATCCSGGARVTTTSSLSRELLFVSSHVTHHLALMKLLAGDAACSVAEDVGVAFSTLVHRESLKRGQ